MAALRKPTSRARERTRGVTLSAASPVFGSSVIVVPRASLLWKPLPMLKYASVSRHGPAITLRLGLNKWSLAVPEFSGRSLRTSKR